MGRGTEYDGSRAVFTHLDEHDSTVAPGTKRVLLYGLTSGGLKVAVLVDASGRVFTSGAAGGGGGFETVTAQQGAPGATAWPVNVSVALPAGTNNIGDVDVLSLPALPAGTNNIGDVDVLSLPALPAGSNNIGDVDVLTLPALPAGTNNIGDVDVLTLPALPAGTNNIGDVDVLSLPLTGTDTPGSAQAGLFVRPQALLPSATTAAPAYITIPAGTAAWVQVLSGNSKRGGFRVRNRASFACYLSYGDPGSAETEAPARLYPGDIGLDAVWAGTVFVKGELTGTSAASGLIVQEWRW